VIKADRARPATAVKAQAGPCHGLVAVVWVGETRGPRGPVHLYSCRDCARTWTASPDGPEVPAP
jgi:hypothetical protein